MPPIRSLPMVKPIKTERSHEENQERAYIAASRRSDRSLEARVESARRASEIHKRRTGRSLRVTEQDVINEEMYEEEDDDLPAQYRRLTAHINSGPSDFNRRLTAYLSNHVAMRNALEQALSNSYQQYPNGTPWAQTVNAVQPPQQFNQNQSQQPLNDSTLSPPMIQTSSSHFRQSPYPLPTDQSLRSQHSPRTASVSPATSSREAPPSESITNSSRPKNIRRASEPVHAMPNSHTGGNPEDTGKSSSASPSTGKAQTIKASLEDGFDTSPQTFQQNPMNSWQQSSGLPTPSSLPPSSISGSNLLGPLSTAMPPEMQMFPGVNFNYNDPFGYRAMTANGKSDTGFNDFSQNSMMRHSSLSGMNQTLAPGFLDTNLNDLNWSSTFSDDVGPPLTAPPFMYNFQSQFSNAFDKQGSPSDGPASGQITPAERDWASFIDQSTWDDGQS